MAHSYGLKHGVWKGNDFWKPSTVMFTIGIVIPSYIDINGAYEYLKNNYDIENLSTKLFN